MNKLMKSISRRGMLGRLAGVTAASWIGSRFAALLAAPDTRRYRIGACDWSIGKMADTAALSVGREIGLDGVQVSLGTAANDMHLRQGRVQEMYRRLAQETGVAVASLAMGELNNIPFKSDERTIAWVRDSIEVCRAMGCRVVLLAFFGNGDLKGDKTGTDEVVRRLKELAPKAEQAGVVLGIESWLSAEEHVDIIERVGSPAVQVYYDVANSEKMGYDIYREIRWLGARKLICEFHLKENGFLLGQGRVDFHKVRAAMEEIGYSGWMQIEGAVPEGAAILPSYRANCRFARDVFNT
jgi:sugar phosphate isomerase/epimerase